MTEHFGRIPVNPASELDNHLLLARDNAARLQAYLHFLPSIAAATPQDGVVRATAAERIAIELRDWAAHIEILRLRAMAHLQIRRPSDALADLDTAAKEAEESGDTAGMVRIFLAMAETRKMLGEPRAAQSWLQKALEVCGPEPSAIRADALEGLADLRISTGRYNDAIELLGESRTIHEQLGDLVGIGRTLCAIGTAYGRLNDLGTAYDHYRRGLDAFDKAGDTGDMVRALANMASIHRTRGEMDDVMEIAWRAYAACEAQGEWTTLACLTITIADMYQQQGEPKLALEYYVKASDILQRYPADELLLGLYQRVGEIHHRQNDLNAARHVYRHAIQVAGKLQERKAECELHKAISSVYEREGYHREALLHLQKFVALQQELAGEEQRRAMAESEMKYDVMRIEQALEEERRHTSQLNEKIARMQLELTRKTIDLTGALTTIDKLKKAFMEMKDGTGGKNTRAEKILRGLEKQTVEENPSGDLPSDAELEWESLKRQLEQVHPHFERTLFDLCPKLTPTEIKICALTKLLGDDSEKIARILNNGFRTVQTQRLKIRRKLKLSREVNFVSFIQAL